MEDEGCQCRQCGKSVADRRRLKVSVLRVPICDVGLQQFLHIFENLVSDTKGRKGNTREIVYGDEVQSSTALLSLWVTPLHEQKCDTKTSTIGHLLLT